MKPRVAVLFRTVAELGDPLANVLASDEIRFATLLGAELSGDLGPQVVALVQHPNVHARRVGIEAVRRARFWAHQEVIAAIVGALDDPDATVRGRAAWALGSSGRCSPAILDGLRRLAGTADARDTVDFDDREQHARVEAAKALQKLDAGPR